MLTSAVACSPSSSAPRCSCSSAPERSSRRSRWGRGKLDYAGLGIVALSFALVVAAAIYMFGTTSGAHINPAVTFSLAVVRRFPWVEVVPYVVAQLAGGAGRGGAHQRDLRVARERPERVRRHDRRRGVHQGAGGGRGRRSGTFLLAGDDHGARRRPARSGGFAGLVIGLAVACEIMVIGPISGGSVNPARTFGPYLATSIFGGSTPWSEFWIYWVGPLVGGALAALAYDRDRPARTSRGAPDAQRPQGTAGDVRGPPRAPGGRPRRAATGSTTEGSTTRWPVTRQSHTSSPARSRCRRSTTPSSRCRTDRAFTRTTSGARPRTGRS